MVFEARHSRLQRRESKLLFALGLCALAFVAVSCGPQDAPQFKLREVPISDGLHPVLILERGQGNLGDAANFVVPRDLQACVLGLDRKYGNIPDSPLVKTGVETNTSQIGIRPGMPLDLADTTCVKPQEPRVEPTWNPTEIAVSLELIRRWNATATPISTILPVETETHDEFLKKSTVDSYQFNRIFAVTAWLVTGLTVVTGAGVGVWALIRYAGRGITEDYTRGTDPIRDARAYVVTGPVGEPSEDSALYVGIGDAMADRSDHRYRSDSYDKPPPRESPSLYAPQEPQRIRRSIPDFVEQLVPSSPLVYKESELIAKARRQDAEGRRGLPFGFRSHEAYWRHWMEFVEKLGRVVIVHDLDE